MLTAVHKRSAAAGIPLVVDLDGTLVRSDLLVETLFSAAASDLHATLDLMKAATEGRASLKRAASARGSLVVETLPYDRDVLWLIEEARAAGRPVYLASASDAALVQRVAEHLGLFDGWYASTPGTNLKSDAKAAKLVAEFGEKGFDYIGNEAADLAVWSRARKAIAVGAPKGVQEQLAAVNPDMSLLSVPEASWRDWLKLLRVHQYAKNLLVLVPLAAAHALTGGAILNAILAFAAFSLCASGIYILNDILDLSADRAHPTKRNRPLANGTVPIRQAVLVAPALIATAFALAWCANSVFAGILAVYLVATTAYSLVLKRMMMIDAVALAGLYTLRVIGGATAIAVPVSRWLLAFSLFIFMALALVKRYVELAKLLDRNLPNPANRDYEKGDLPVIASLAAAAGYNAVIVLALYVSSDAVTGLYRQPQMLWLVCPVMMYWISRLILKAHRRQIDDDPVVFALKDRVSLGVAATIGLLGYLAL